MKAIKTTLGNFKDSHAILFHQNKNTTAKSLILFNFNQIQKI